MEARRGGRSANRAARFRVASSDASQVFVPAPLTDAEEAEIQRMIASDPDNPELTDGQIAGLRPFAEVLPALAESAKRSPGRPKLEKTLEPVTLRLDPSVVEHFRAQGADWRKRMARVLAKAAS